MARLAPRRAVAPSKSREGANFERGVSNLALILSGGDQQPTRPVVDEKDVDRVITRLGSRRAAFLQLKTRTGPVEEGDLFPRLLENPLRSVASRSGGSPSHPCGLGEDVGDLVGHVGTDEDREGLDDVK